MTTSTLFDDFCKYISFIVALQDFVNFKSFLRKKGETIAEKRGQRRRR
jgi:hypothetical protein